jgi:hypothetical protein
LDPVVSASRLTAGASRTEGKLSVHDLFRMILCVVFDAAEIPMIQRQPSQNTDDMGATLKLPSSLQVLINTTGVPK